MSEHDFIKGACRRCGGHLEFPADAVGQTIACPHCGQPTQLEPSVPAGKITGSRRAGWMVGLLVFLAGAGAVGFFFAKENIRLAAKVPPQVPAKPTAPTNLPATSIVSVISPNQFTNLPAETVTNEFALLPFHLEKTPGSSLVYVTGTICNLSSRQRYGVKVEFGLLDTNDLPVGKATDYQPVLDPHGNWHFKALVIGAKAASARFSSISEH